MLRILSKLLLVSVLWGDAYAQEVDQQGPYRIRDFKGLNTIAGVLQLKPNEAILAHDVDWSRNRGSISKRYGFDEAFAITGHDSIIGIYAQYKEDGTQRLLLVADSTGVGYGNIYATAVNSADTANKVRILTHWGIQSRPSFSMLQDNVYIFNGINKGVVWNGTKASRFPINAPGQMTMIPIAVASGLTGEYRYVFEFRGSRFNVGYASEKIKTSNSQVMIKDFQWVTGDSAVSSPDTLKIVVYRTLANPGRLTNGVYAYLTEDTIKMTSADVGTTIHIDSIADASLDTTTKVLILNNSKYLSINRRRYGAPGLISRDTNATGNDNGIRRGAAGAAMPIEGWAYFATFVDTVYGIESDTSRGFYTRDDDENDSVYIISVPQKPDSAQDIVINLYRAPVYTVTYDSVLLSVGGAYDIGWFVWSDSTFMGPPKLVQQLSASDTSYLDTLGWDTLATRKEFQSVYTPNIEKVFSYQNRLYGVSGSNLAFSKLDTGWSWGALDFISFGDGDGDEANVAFPARTVIRVLKNMSSYNAFQDANLNWNRREVSNHIGCIAPLSYAAGIGGHYYLSAVGVIIEGEGSELERTNTTRLLSAKLANFTNLSYTVLSRAHGFYHNQKYLLTIGDTTYVYDERADAWSTWSLTIGGATHYGVESSKDFIPGDTMYFFAPGGAVVHRFGTSEQDNGASVAVRWWSAPILISEQRKVLTAIGVWRGQGTTDTLSIAVLDQDDGILTTALKITGTDRHSKRVLLSGLDFNYIRLALTVSSRTAAVNPVIDGFDIYTKRVSEQIIE